MIHSDNGALVVFAREPVPGEVKTRLIPALGPTGAARLYAGLLERTVTAAEAVAFEARYLFAAAPAQTAYFERALRKGVWQVRAQAAGDLGRRMHDAFERVLARHPFALLTGSDMADVGPTDLAQAAARLRAGGDAVLGPSADGGYWLLGLRAPLAALFDDMPWGGATVAADTRAVLAAHGLAWVELPVRHDIDRPADIARLAGAAGASRFFDTAHGSAGDRALGNH